MKVPFLNFAFIHKPLEEEMQQVFNEVYSRNWFVLGDKVEAFEKKYAKFNDTQYALGTSNGLDALFLSLKALGIGPGDEVLLPSNTYIASALAVGYTGAKPVLVEPDINTYNIKAGNIVNKITPKTKAIMPVHLYGQACEMEDIMEVAKVHDLFVVEDNAQAHSAAYKGKKTGGWGEVNGTSFYPGKNLGALGDGGAITFNDPVYREKLEMLRNYGSKEKYRHEIIGYNKRLDELQAAFLGIKLPHLLKWTEQRQSIATQYEKKLRGIGDLVLPHVADKSTHVYHLYVIRTAQRDELQQYLKNKGVDTLIHYPIPIHLQKAYGGLDYKEGDLPIAEKLAGSSLSLPIWPGMSINGISYVCDTIRDFYVKDNH